MRAVRCRRTKHTIGHSQLKVLQALELRRGVSTVLGKASTSEGFEIITRVSY